MVAHTDQTNPAMSLGQPTTTELATADECIASPVFDALNQAWLNIPDGRITLSPAGACSMRSPEQMPCRLRLGAVGHDSTLNGGDVQKLPLRAFAGRWPVYARSWHRLAQTLGMSNVLCDGPALYSAPKARVRAIICPRGPN
jgi:hypothetical protein